MNISRVQKHDYNYPAVLNRYLTNTAPKTITAIGNLDILKNKTLAVFSSAKCPGKIILKTYDLMRDLKDKGVTVISGFHSPMEQECLNILLKGKQPVIVCPARSIEGMRIKPGYKKPLDEERLLILSPFSAKEKRISVERAKFRNFFAAAIADKIFVPYSEPKSKTELLCKELVKQGKIIMTLESSYNKNLFEMGAEAVKKVF